jgi:aldehyde:ferredoxin oxidoreductase
MLTGIQAWNLFDYFNAATGRNLSPDDYMEMGRRTQTLRQLFNIKHGLDPRQAMLPDRLSGRPPLDNGPLKGKSYPLLEKVALHWKAMGWNSETGCPETSTIEKLGMGDIVARHFPKGLEFS